MTEEEIAADEEAFYKLAEEVDELAEEVEKTEKKAQDALKDFGSGIDKAEMYLKKATNDSTASRNQVTLVNNHLLEKKQAAWDNVQGKTQDYRDYESKQRAIAYGTCGGICGAFGIMTGGAACVACFGTAALVLENKLSDYRDENREMMRKYNNMSSEMQVVLDKVMNIINSLDSLDDDIVNVGELIDTARLKYETIEDSSIKFLTEDAGNKDGTYADFMEMLKNTIDFEKNLS